MMVKREKQGKTNLINQMGEFTGQLEVYIVPGKCSPVALKGINWLVFPFFPKNSWYNTSNLQGCWEKTNKQTNKPINKPLHPSPLLLFFKSGNRAKGQKSNPCICQPANLTSIPSETMGQPVKGGGKGDRK